MPFALFFIGTVFILVGYQGTQSDFFSLLKGDLAGTSGFKSSFVAWIVAIAVIGGLGYIPRFKPISNAFLVLVVIVLIIANGGFFAKFNQQIFGSSTDITAQGFKPGPV